MPKNKQMILQHALQAKYEAIVAGQCPFFDVPSIAVPRIPRVGLNYGSLQRILIYPGCGTVDQHEERTVEALPRHCAKLLMDARRALFVSGMGASMGTGSTTTFLEEIAMGCVLKRDSGGSVGWRAALPFITADVELLDPHVILPARSLLQSVERRSVLAFLQGFGRPVLPFGTVACSEDPPARNTLSQLL